MFKKILIANRSEIACRIIKTCKELGIKTVAIYSDPDKNALHKRLADEAYNLPGEKASETYLNMSEIIKIAINNNCEAIHPGYGFLSENTEFNRLVRESGLVFIGPDPESMALLGSKTQSRITMQKVGIPIIPGMMQSYSEIAPYEEFADKAGYPILLKASAGGGGKGMRIVRKKEELADALDAARRESISAFGSDEIFAEKYIEQPRHIEFQVAADNFGNVVHLFERECSIQRRHQKIIEETPSVALNHELREKMGEAAVKAIQAANYTNLATVEFLLAHNSDFYFLEVNARIQVEHPITEETTGFDLVKLQLEIASGEKIPFTQKMIKQTGHSIECRLYSEDWENNFLPSAGHILYYKEPSGAGIRMDSGIEMHTNVSVFYDPILAKLIVKANDRNTAINKMLVALRNTVILGIKHSIPFLINCLKHNGFIAGNTHTDFINSFSEDLFIKNEPNDTSKAIASAYVNKPVKQNFASDNLRKELSPWETIGSWEICSSFEK